MVRVFSLVSLAVQAAALGGDWAVQDEALSLLQHKVVSHHSDHEVQHKITSGEEKGNSPTPRAHPDGATNIEFIDNGAGGFAEAGKLASVKFWVSRAGNMGLRFRIYRPSGGGFNYIAQTEEIEMPTANVMQEYTFTEQVPFLAGDYIGWSHRGNGNIPFDGNGKSVIWHYGPTNDGCVNVPSSGTQPRTYSYAITTAPASAADYAGGELCGADVPEGLVDEGAAVGDPHLTYGSEKKDLEQSDLQ